MGRMSNAPLFNLTPCIQGNLTALFQQVYFSILGPEAQARVETWLAV